jgi:hypothetical protein
MVSTIWDLSLVQSWVWHLPAPCSLISSVAPVQVDTREIPVSKKLDRLHSDPHDLTDLAVGMIVTLAGSGRHN